MTASRRTFLCLAASMALPVRARPDGFSGNFEGVALQDQHGRAFRIEALAGKIKLVNFIYTGCSLVCSTQTRALAEVLQGLPPEVKRSVHFVSVSLEPVADSPAVLKDYAQKMGAESPQWSFLTGRPAEIEHLVQRLRVYRSTTGVPRPEDHSTNIWLVDTLDRPLQRYHGNPVDTKRLRAELVQLQESTPKP